MLGILKDQTNMAARFCRSLLVGNVYPIHQHLATRRCKQAIHVLHKRTLAATRVARDANKFAFLYGERNVFERPEGIGRVAPVGLGLRAALGFLISFGLAGCM